MIEKLINALHQCFKPNDANKCRKKTAATLTEIIVAMTVIGIIATVTIPVFIHKIKTKVMTRQVSVAKIKFTEAMEQMMADGKIAPYYNDTREFTNELQKYLKIAKVCYKGHLSECFGHDKITLSDGSEFNIEDINDGAVFGMPYNDKSDYEGDTVGILTLDGTAMVLAWNKKCQSLTPGLYEWSNDTNISTACVAMVMDVNTDSGPNKVNKDVVLFRAAKIAKEECGMKFYVGGEKYCWGAPFIPIPLTNTECEQSLGLQQGCDYATDYWAGAYKKCHDEGKHLPTANELKSLAQYLYSTQSINSSGSTSNLTISTSKLESLPNVILANYQSNSNLLYMWSGLTPSSANYAYYRSFGVGSSGYYTTFYRNSSNFLGVCVP